MSRCHWKSLARGEDSSIKLLPGGELAVGAEGQPQVLAGRGVRPGGGPKEWPVRARAGLGIGVAAVDEPIGHASAVSELVLVLGHPQVGYRLHVGVMAHAGSPIHTLGGAAG